MSSQCTNSSQLPWPWFKAIRSVQCLDARPSAYIVRFFKWLNSTLEDGFFLVVPILLTSGGATDDDVSSRSCIWSCEILFSTIDDNVYRVKFEIEDKIGDTMDNLLETALR